MHLNSPQEDFESRTLNAFPGLLGKIAYMCSLLDGCALHHWGLERAYGAEVARGTLQNAFVSLVTDFLSRGLEDHIECLKDGEETLVQLKKVETCVSNVMGKREATMAHWRWTTSVLLKLTQAQSQGA